ncbi:tenascin-X-like [Aquarana catesbeiana]
MVLPDVVKNLTAENITTTSISLRWDKPDGNVSSYFIQILEDPRFNKIATTTYEIIKGLTPGNYYTFLVSACVGEINVQGKNLLIVEYTKPGVVKNLKTENITTTSISLSWEKPDGNASSYFIQILEDPTFDMNVTTTSYTIEILTPGNYYTILVYAQVGENNVQGAYDIVSNYTIPDVVKNLTAENITTTSISLRWDKPDGNVSSYFIQILEDPRFNTIATTTYEIIKGLTPGNYYTFLVSARVGENNVQGKNLVIVEYTKPGVVKNLKTENITTTSISLSWEKPDGNASSYFIQILEDPTFDMNVTTTSYTIESLTPGNYYTILVYAQVGENNVQGAYDIVSNYTIPEVVKNLTAENITTTSISLRWDKPDGNVSSYFVQILEDPRFNTIATTTYEIIKGLTPGNYYTFLVSARVGENNVQGKNLVIVEYTKPGVVKNLKTENITTTSISLSWEKPDGNASSYFIQILEDPTFDMNVTTTSYTIEILTPGNYYTILVYAQVGENNVQGAYDIVSNYTIPDVVKNLTAENITTTSISLRWDKPDGNVSSYFIQILEDPRFNKIATTTYEIIKGLTPGNYYTFLVSARVGEINVQGKNLLIVEYTKPGVVKNLKTENITTTSISLSWEKPDGNASSYFIQILEDPTFDMNVTTTSYTIESLTPGNYYTILVYAQVGENNVQGAYDIVSNYTKPGIVKNLTMMNVTATSVSLSWDKPDGNASSYFIQILEEPAFNKNVTSTFDTIEGLTPGNYTFLVSALVGDFTVQGEIVIISAFLQPEAVMNLKIENVSTTSIALSWSIPDGKISSYFIQILQKPNFTKNVTTTSVIIENLTPGNYYTFLVFLITANNVPGKINSISAYTIPEVVKNLNTENITTTSISLRWEKPDGNAIFYFIQILGEPSFNSNVTTTFEIIEGLTPGNYYTFLVSTFVNNIQGNSSVIANYTQPDVVGNLMVQKTYTTAVLLSWEKPAGNADFYGIKIQENTTYQEKTNATSFMIQYLTPGNYYTFLVTAIVGKDVEGNTSSTHNYTKPAIVTNLKASRINNSNTIDVSWELPEGNRSYYMLDVWGEPTQSFNFIPTELATITNLTIGNQYIVIVKAVVGDGLQGDSNEISILLSDIINATLIYTTSVWLSWNPYAGVNSSYRISVYGEPSSNLTVNTTQVYLNNLTAGNFYTIKISAYINNTILYGYGGDIALYTRPAMVKDVQVDNLTTNSFILSWLPPDGNYSYYWIEVTGDIPINSSEALLPSYSIQGLTPGNQYTVMIRAVAGKGVLGEANTTVITPRPEVVKNLTILSFTDTSVSLSWQAPKGSISSYIIQIQENGTYYASTTQTSFTVNDLTPGNNYTFLVTTLAGSSNTVEGDGASISCSTQPGEVKNLTVGNIDTTSISLSWEKPNGNVSSYFIQILEDQALNRNVTTTSDTIMGLIPGYYYTFLVYALAVNNTIQGNSSVVGSNTKPEMVKNLTADNITITSLLLSWEKPETNVSFYYIQILQDPNFIRNTSTTYFTVENLTPGNNYTFLVIAVAGMVEGNVSQISAYTPPEKVQSLTAYNISTTSLSLNWLPPTGNASSYQIQILENVSFSVIVNSPTTSYTIQNLIPGNYYTFLVSALVGGNSIKGDSSMTVNYTMPEKVQSLTAYDITTTSLSLNWLPPTGNASSYQIQIQENPSFSIIVNSPTTSYTIQNLTPGNYYTFLVSALVGGNSIKGNSSVTVNYTIPEKVQSLAASNITTTSVSLSWLQPTGNASSYQIQIQENPSFSIIVNSPTTSYTIQNLVPGNYYTFLVSALVGGNSIKGDSSVTVNYTIPEKVQSLAASNITTTSVSLSWLQPTGNASSYQIQIQENPSFSIIVNSPTTSYTIQNLVPGNYYTFLVSALVGGNSIKGDSSVTVNYTIPEKVQSLAASNITTTSVSLSWLQPTGNASSYQIQIQENPSFSIIVNSPTTSYTIQNLVPGNYYTFLVSALVGGNSIKGDSSVTVNYTIPEKVQSLAASNITTTSVSLSWLQPTGNASSYQIQIQENPSFSIIVNSPTTSYTIQNLVPGNYYTFLVSALVGGNSIRGDSSVTVNYTIPEKVQSLAASNITTTSVSLSWLQPTGNASSYQIQIQENPSFSIIVNSPTTSYTIQNLVPGNYYTFLVSALVGGNSIRGDSSVTVNYTIPEKVQSLAASNITTTSVSLSWLQPTGNASSYQIQIQENPSFSIIVNSPTTSYTIQNLVPGNYYTFLVSALVGGNSIRGDSSVTVNYTIPEKVQSLAASNITTTSVSLSWLQPTGNASSYQIQIQENPSFSIIVNSPTTSYTIQNLVPGNYYTFLVSALVGGNSIRGDSSVTVNYTIPEKVQSLAASNITTTSVSLSWLQPTGNASSYQIQIQENPSFSIIVNSPTTSYTIQNLVPGNYYTFLVSALVGGNGIKGDSSVTVNYTIPEKVQSLAASNITTTSVSLSWLQPTGNASSYQIQIQENPSFSIIVNSPTTSYTIQNLVPGNYYTFLVSALVGGNSIRGDSSVTVNYTIPEKVQSLAASNITTTSVSLSWLQPTGNASSYQIQIQENPSFSIIVNSPTTSYTIQNLVPGNYYTFLVSALVGGNSIRGDSSVTVNYTIPEKVQSLAASNITTTSVSLSWLQPTGNASSYQIQIQENPSFSIIVNSPTTSYTIQNLVPGNYYTFLVSALVGGNSIRGDSSVTVNYTIPEKVQSLAASNITTTSVSLSWLQPTGNASSYQIQIQENPSFSIIVNSPTTSYTIQNLVPGNYYTFLVSALVGGNSIRGDSSVTVNYTIPEKVQSLAASNITTTSVSLSWLQPTGNASSYQIQIQENPSFSIIVNSPTTSYTIQNLVPGNYYTFLVSALVGGNGIKGDSSVTVNYTIPEKVQSLAASNITTTSVSLSWLQPTGNASSYQIQIQENPSFSINVNSPTTSYTIQNLVPGNYYTFLVSALLGGNSIKGDSSVTVNYTIPEKVQSLAASNITTTSVSLSWLQPTGNASSYQIQIQENPSFSIIVNSPTTSYTIQNLVPGNYYTFLVSALVGGNSIKGDSSVTVNYTMPEKVQSLTAYDITTTSLSLNWLPPTGNAGSYQIRILENSSFSIIVPSPTTSYTIQNLIPGNYYTFLVSALVGGNSIKGNSSVTVNYTIPEKVQSLAASNITTTSVSLSWLQPTGNASSYQIQIQENPSFSIIVNSPTTSYTIQNLVPGNYYTFLVSALVGGNSIKGDSSVTVNYTIPEKVQSLAASNITTTSVSLSWLQPTGNASSYQIQIQENPSFSIIVNSPTTSYTIQNLVPGNYYTFLVSALVGGNSIKGDSSVTVNYTMPEKVQSLTAYDITTTSLSLNWLPPTGNASSYQIRILENSSFSIIVPSPTTSYTIQNLIPGNYYTFLVSALVGGNSIKGNSSVTVNYTIPEKVQSLAASNITTTSVSLSWLQPTGNASSYQIQIQENPSFSIIVNSPTTSYTIQNLVPGNYYTFLVSALVGGNSIKGDSSVTVNYTIPEKVQSLAASNITTTSVSLSWLQPTGNASSYQIQIQENPSFSIIVNSPTTSYTIQNLVPGNYYTFLVSALVGGNSIKGDSSVTVNYTMPEKVQSLTAYDITTTSLSLNWLPPTGNASSYQIRILENSSFSIIVPSPTTSYTIQNLIPGNYYTFLVSALVGGNSIKGNSSVTVNYTIPEKVQSLAASNITTTSVSLSWLQPTGNASSYQIQIQENPSFSIIVNSPTTSYTIQNLVPGNYYTFLVSALVGGNSIKGDSSVTVNYTSPEKVQSLANSNITTTSVSLSWLQPTGNASSYQIQIRENSSFSIIVPSPTTSYTIQNLIPGNYYTFLVSALVGGNSIKGDSSVTVNYTSPEKVQSLANFNITTTSVSLSWLQPTGNASSYQIQIRENSSFSIIVPSPTTSYTIQNLIPGNYYTFLVSALVGGNSIKGDSSVTVNYTSPEKVQSLANFNITTTSVSLSWLQPTGNASSYQIQIRENSSFSIIVPSSTTSYTIQNLIPGNYYTFLVSALVGGNSIKGDSSVTVNYTKPGTVKNLIPLKITTDSISLSWEKPDGNVSSYMILIKENSTFQSNITTMNVTISNLQPGNTYTFLVFALTDNSRLQGNNVSTIARTNSISFIVSLSYQSSSSDSEILIVNLINEKLQANFPKQNVTAVIKKVQKISS